MSTMGDLDPMETGEWVDALEAVRQHRGGERTNYLLNRLVDEGRREGVYVPRSLTTAYKNTIPPEKEEKSTGDRAIEHRLRSIIRWNAMAIILRANKDSSELGGHIASFQSAATLYDIGFGHFWHAATDTHGGDLLFIQGHSSPGIYARAFLEGRLSEQQLLNYRQEADGDGIPSYPHPWLMPDFWQFPTVSMGLGPLMAIYQARFLKYLHGRGLADTAPRKVWAFMGDGEMDEPESLGAISLAGRESLDNLVFVINCNLQRLDGPVRGNGKIVQELESVFRGAGWNVIKVLWGGGWDKLLAADKSGKLLQRMEECVDGEYQDFKSKSGAYVREHFFGKYEETRALVADMSDDEIWGLTRGGHDPEKVFAAYAAAVKHTGQPTLILPKTVKGYGMGESGEGQMIAHQAKKMTQDALRGFRDRFQIPVSDEDLPNMPFIKPADDSPEDAVPQGTPGRAGRLPAAAPAEIRRAADPAAGHLRALAQGHRRARDLHHHGLRADAGHAGARQEHRQARGAHRARRVAHLRHGRHVPPARHLVLTRPAVQAAGRRPAHVLPRVQGRPGAAGGHQRRRRHVQLDRGRHLVQHEQRADDPVLHLLLDVRPAARGRPGLAGRRHPCARLPVGWHGRAHHAERRRPAARGRPQPHPGRHHPQLRQLRPDLRPTRWWPSCAMACAACTKTRRTCTTTSP